MSRLSSQEKEKLYTQINALIADAHATAEDGMQVLCVVLGSAIDFFTTTKEEKEHAVLVAASLVAKGANLDQQPTVH